MKKTVCFAGFLFFAGCGNKNPLPQALEAAPSFFAHKSIKPRVYLNQEDRLMDIPELNRSGIVLSLSDQIVFFNKGEDLSGSSPAGPIISAREKSDISAPFLDKLDNFKTVEDLKIKISSFCSYLKQKADSNSPPKTDRAFQEFASRSYHRSFAIADLLPEEIFLSPLDQNFYCSFIFAVKGEEGVFDYYNVAQRIIEPSFAGGTNSLSLIRESDSGQYFAVAGGAIKAQHVGKIFLARGGRPPAKSYHLFCEGLKIMTVPGWRAENAPVFLSLIGSRERGDFPEGGKICRFFSESFERRITGMTDSFSLDFNELGFYKGNKIDLSRLKAPALVSHLRENSAYLTDFMFFENLSELSGSYQDYLSIDVTVKASCFDESKNREINLFGSQERVASARLAFPLRPRFPLAAVSPKKLFQLGAAYDPWLTAKHKIESLPFTAFFGRLLDKLEPIPEDYGFQSEMNRQKILEETAEQMLNQVFCFYEISARDRSDPKNAARFKPVKYFIEWNRESYGADYVAFFGRGPFISEEDQKAGGADFFSLDRIKRDEQSYLQLLFFDMEKDFSHPAEGYDLDRIGMECRKSGDMGSNIGTVEVSWPYVSGSKNLLLKTAFSNREIENFIKRKKKAVCRMMLYEGDMLRYFSGEMRVEK